MYKRTTIRRRDICTEFLSVFPPIFSCISPANGQTTFTLSFIQEYQGTSITWLSEEDSIQTQENNVEGKILECRIFN